MQLHELKSNNKNRGKKRIARGGKRGTTSGRGQKGQKSRSGHRIRPAERDLIQRLPKLRGFRNKSLKAKSIIINIADLEKKIEGNLINKKVLIDAGFIRKADNNIKILGNSEVKKEFQIEEIKVSKNVKNKIEAAGGSVRADKLIS